MKNLESFHKSDIMFTSGTMALPSDLHDCKYSYKLAAYIEYCDYQTLLYIVSVSHFLLPIFETLSSSDCPSSSSENRNV